MLYAPTRRKFKKKPEGKKQLSKTAFVLDEV